MATRPSSGRLHPAAIAVWSLGQLGGLGLLWLVGPLGGAAAVVLGTFVVGASALRYLRFRWAVVDDALVIEQGLLQRQRRVIPLERIQGVDLVRTLRHRLLGVVEVRAEAVGGSETEGRLDALAPATAAHVRELLLHTAPAEPGGADRGPAGRVLASVGPGGLVAAGLTGGRVGVMAALLGFAQQMFPEDALRWFERLPALVGLRGLFGAVVALLVVAFVLSVVATVVTHWGFTVVAEDDAVRIRRGLLEQRAETVPLRRIQAVRVEENLLRRLLGLAAVKVDLAGRGGGSDRRESGLVLPVGRTAAAFELAAHLTRKMSDGGDVSPVGVELEVAPRGALERRVVRAGAAGAGATALLAWLLWPGGLAAAVVVMPLGLAAALLSYRALGHARSGDVLVVRYGLLVRRTAYVPVTRVHSLALTASPFQRRRDLASLDFQIPRSAGAWAGPQAIDIDAGTGARLLGELAAELR